ncbi:MAG TPA: mannosyltransferase family protein, partial [Ktedonobacterales bacterium]|nr:mannosyltransferase family protein [Ktedonobacterales bacterium]
MKWVSATTTTKVPADSAAALPAPAGWLVKPRRRLSPEWAAAWRLGLILWAATRVGLVLITYFGQLLTSFTASSTPGALVNAWKQWDVNWYLEIAQHGYDSPQTTAFFPLYPMLIRAVHFVVPGLSYFGSALLISNGALLGALVLLIRLLTREFGSETARVTAVLFLLYPAAFYLSTGYSESLFLLWVFGAFLALRSGNWLVAGVLAGLATLTRPTGGMLALAFGWEYLRQSPVSWATVQARGLSLRQWLNDQHALRILLGRLGTIALMPLAVLLYAGYLWKRFGDPLLFKKVEGAYWNHHSALPTKGLYLGVSAL